MDLSNWNYDCCVSTTYAPKPYRRRSRMIESNSWFKCALERPFRRNPPQCRIRHAASALVSRAPSSQICCAGIRPLRPAQAPFAPIICRATHEWQQCESSSVAPDRRANVSCRPNISLGAPAGPMSAICKISGLCDHLNATSTRLRRFGTVDDGENRSMSGAVGMEKTRNQKLGR